MGIRAAVIAVSVFLSGGVGVVAGQGMRAVETRDVQLVYYSPTHAYLVPHLIRSFENAFAFHRKLFHYQSKEKVVILFEDFADSMNGGSTALPRNFLDIGIAPPNYVFETALANDRMVLLMNHELMHTVTNDQAAGQDRWFRRFFLGKVTPIADDPVSIAYGYLTNPRHYAPRWYHEGMAVFMETWMGGGLGRALGGYDEMVFRAKVRDGAHIYDPVGLESEGTTIDFQAGANSYLYGTRFITHMASQQGIDKFVNWVRRDPGSRRYFSTQFQHIYGQSLGEAWTNWIASEQAWQRANLERIRQYPVTPLKRLTSTTLGSISRMYWDARKGRIYAAVQYPGQVAHLAVSDLETGVFRKIIDLKGAALYYVCSLAWDPDSRTLFYTTDNKTLRDLNAIEPDTGRHRLLMRDARTGDLAFDRATKTLWGIRRTDGLSSIVRFTAPYREWTELLRCEYGHDLFDIDISPDGQYLTAAQADVSGRQKLVRFLIRDLLNNGSAGKVQPETLHDFEFSSPSNFVFAPDGRYLYGTSYYTGVSNVFRYDFELKKMEVLSNAETGLFRPLPRPDGSLLALEYTASGFVPVSMPVKPIEDVSAIQYLGQQVVERYPVVKSWELGSPAEIDLAKEVTYEGAYHPRHLELLSAYPIVQGYKDTAAVGWRFDMASSVFLSTLTGYLSFSPGAGLTAAEHVHAGFSYQYFDWKLTGGFNNADFYDLFGPTKNSRKGYFLEIEKRKILIYDMPRTLNLEWNVAGYGGLDRLPDYQNVIATYPRFLTGKIALKYSFVDRSLGAVDDEKGVAWQLALRDNVIPGKTLPRLYGTYDYGFLTPIRNSPIWIRSAAGYSVGGRNEPFANFYFGGFGNNWVDHQDISRYRDYYSFPGLTLQEVGARTFAKTMVEWSLPAVHFRKLGTTYLYCNWVRLSLFSSGLLTEPARASGRTLYGNGGAQLDFRIVPFSFLRSTFSLGYAVARGTRGERGSEVMVSLKLL
jgi:WD40 repeat protein